MCRTSWLLSLSLLTSCSASHIIVRDIKITRQPDYVLQQSFYLFGFKPAYSLKVSEMCGSKDAVIDFSEYFTPLDLTIAIFSLGLVVTRTVAIYCHSECI